MILDYILLTFEFNKDYSKKNHLRTLFSETIKHNN